MHPPSRTRRILKWTGVGACTLVVAAWAYSFYTMVEYISPGKRWHVSACKGGIVVFWGSSGPMTTRMVGWEFHPWPRNYFAFSELLEFGLPGPVSFSTGGAQTGDPRAYVFPYCFLFVIAATPTLILFYRDRKRVRPGCCLRCGYDLTGNTSGVCSECGAKIAAGQRAGLEPPPRTA